MAELGLTSEKIVITLTCAHCAIAPTPCLLWNRTFISTLQDNLA
ncbi:MAG: hypothetical protein AB4426_32845 [Xenococcaceae cyanobacterium]